MQFLPDIGDGTGLSHSYFQLATDRGSLGRGVIAPEFPGWEGIIAGMHFRSIMEHSEPGSDQDCQNA